MKSGKAQAPKRAEADTPAGWLSVNQALSWIAFRSVTPDWDIAFYFGASNWFAQTPDEALEQLRQMMAEPPGSLFRTMRYGPDFQDRVCTVAAALGLCGDDGAADPQTASIDDLTTRLIDHLSAHLQDARAQHDRLKQAAETLRLAIASGEPSAYGWRGYGSQLGELEPVAEPRERIPADVCAGPVTITEMGIVPLTEVDGRTRTSQPLWSGILIPSDSVLNLWPASNGKATADLVPRAIPDCLKVSDGTPPRRPQYSPKRVAGWYLGRIDGWPKDAAPPTEAQDLADAKQAFEGDVPRRVIREIRKAKAPENWRKSGPRKPR